MTQTNNTMHYCKTTPSDVQKIRAMYKGGWTTREIADHFNIPLSRVNKHKPNSVKIREYKRMDDNINKIQVK